MVDRVMHREDRGLSALKAFGAQRLAELPAKAS